MQKKNAFPSILMNEIVSGKMINDVTNLELQVQRNSVEFLTVDLKNIDGKSNVYIRECSEKLCIHEKYIKGN